MHQSIYRVWIITGILITASGTLFFASSPAGLIAFLAGAGLVLINLLLLGKGVSSLVGNTRGKAPFIILLILKYAFLLTTLYIAIVIIKLHPVPFIAGISVLPLSAMIMGIFLTVRRQDNA